MKIFHELLGNLSWSGGYIIFSVGPSHEMFWWPTGTQSKELSTCQSSAHNWLAWNFCQEKFDRAQETGQPCQPLLDFIRHKRIWQIYYGPQAFQFPAGCAVKRCTNNRGPQNKQGVLWPPPKHFLHLKMLKSTPKCPKLTLEVLTLTVNIFRFKMQKDPIWAYNQMAKKLSAPHKKAQNRLLGNYKVCPNSRNWKALPYLCRRRTTVIR
jgi:hypothetical protein